MIKELTPCHAKSIQNAITLPWQQMKTCRPLRVVVVVGGGAAGSLIFSARLSGRKAPRGCYGNRLIICKGGGGGGWVWMEVGGVSCHGNVGVDSVVSIPS